MAKRKLSSEKTKRIFLGALGVLLMAVFIYQLFLSSPTPKPRLSPHASATAPGAPGAAQSSEPATPRIRQMGSVAQQEAARQLLLSDMTPLTLKQISSVS